MTSPRHEDSAVGWADKPVVRQRIRLALYILCALLVLAELFVTRGSHNPVEAFPLIYVLYGFAALVFAVLVAKGLRAIVQRDEDYYDS